LYTQHLEVSVGFFLPAEQFYFLPGSGDVQLSIEN